MATLQYDRLSAMTVVATSAGAQYTNPAATKSYVRGFLFHNVNAAAQTVATYWVPASGGSVGTAGNTNRILYSTIQPNETQIIALPYGMTLNSTNETIQATNITGTANAVYMSVLGDYAT